jgi:DNA-binding LacI/PurR family transcriptional regulator
MINLSQNAFPLVTVHRYTTVPLIPCVHVSYENSLLASVDISCRAGTFQNRIYYGKLRESQTLSRASFAAFKLGLKKNNLFYDDSYILDESVLTWPPLNVL